MKAGFYAYGVDAAGHQATYPTGDYLPGVEDADAAIDAVQAACIDAAGWRHAIVYHHDSETGAHRHVRLLRSERTHGP